MDSMRYNILDIVQFIVNKVNFRIRIIMSVNVKRDRRG